MTETVSTEKQPSTPPFFYVAPLLIVVVVGALFFMGGDKQQADEGDKNKPSVEVKVGKDYYMLVTLMEFHPKKINGAKWDKPDSAPDIFYHLQWHDKTIFSTENNAAKDVLIGKWMGLGADIKLSDLGKILKPAGKRLTPLNAIKAALISAEQDGELVVRAYDNDALRDDFAGQCALRVTDLKQGDNEFFIDINGHATRDRDDLAKDRGGLKRFVLRVVDSALPIEELVKALR